MGSDKELKNERGKKMEINKDSQESIAYRKAMRENYLNEKRVQLIKELKERDRRIFWSPQTFVK